MYLLNWLMALYTKSLPLDLVRSCLLASTLRHATDRSACMPIALSCPRHALPAREGTRPAAWCMPVHHRPVAESLISLGVHELMSMGGAAVLRRGATAKY
jgi:hypothetical protein